MRAFVTPSALALVLAVGLVFGLAGSSQAFGPMGDGPLKAYELLFTAEQNEKLEKLKAASEPELAPLREKVHAEMKVLRAMMRDESKDDAAIQGQVQKIAEAGSGLAVKEAAFIRAARKIATTEQLAKIDAQRDKREKKRADVRAQVKAARKAQEAKAAVPAS